MDCAEAKPLLPSYVREGLGGPDRGSVEEHLAVCDDCSLAVDLLRHPPAAPAENVADWTVEKIFSDGQDESPPADVGNGASGAAGGATAAAAAATAAAEPNPVSMPFPEAAPSPIGDSGPSGAPSFLPPQPAPAPTPSPARSGSPAAPPGPGAGDWEFEPAGPNVESAPPEESLVFAEEALGRRRDRSQVRHAAVRALVWGLGGVAGLGLLAASIWVAVAVQPATTGGNTASRAPVPAPLAPALPDPAPGATHAPPSTTPVTAGPTASGSIPEPAKSAPPAGERVAPQPVTPAAVSEKGTTPRKSPAPPAAASSQPPARRDAPTAKPVPERSVTAMSPVKAASPTAPAPSGPSGTASEAPAANAPAKPVPDDLDMWPVDDVVPPPAKMPAPAKTVVTGERSDAPAPAPSPSTSAGAPEAPEPESPKPKAPRTALDRLHEATEKATEEADLDALRRLREAWKNHLKTAVGPTRSRAKREYADCLWAIQMLTGRQDDQREALLAYRDFLISAPAGGADPRSAARLRQLEDVLVERR